MSIGRAGFSLLLIIISGIGREEAMPCAARIAATKSMKPSRTSSSATGIQRRAGILQPVGVGDTDIDIEVPDAVVAAGGVRHLQLAGLLQRIPEYQMSGSTQYRLS